MEPSPDATEYDTIRQTGKFRPIPESTYQPPEQLIKISFKVTSIITISPSSSIRLEKHVQTQSKLWRLYFQQPLSTYTQQSLVRNVEKCFEVIARTREVQQNKNAEVFINSNGLLVERLRILTDQYFPSTVDYNCLVVVLRVERIANHKQFRLECFQVDTGIVKEQRQFQQQIYIKLRQQFIPFYLTSISSVLYIIKDPLKDFPRLDISDQNLEQTTLDIINRILIINSLSPRIIAIKFGQHNSPVVTEPLQIKIQNSEIFEYLLYRINRIKYQRYKIQESDNKEWHSFDEKLKIDGKKANKTTPQKVKKTGKNPSPNITINIKSNESTNFVEQQRQQCLAKKNRGNMLNQQKPMKISQKVITNPKESNLIASQFDYPASLTDENDKDVTYIDDFQTLLYDEDAVEEKQLSLNDSFEEFEKKQNCSKTKQILETLNRKKQKQIEEQMVIESLKSKVEQLMKEEKQMINQNLTLKIQIKKLFKAACQKEEFQQLAEMKNSITELKKQEKKLLDQIAGIKADNNIEALVFGEPQGARSSESQRNSEKRIYSSISGFPIKVSQNNLTTSVRSNKGQESIQHFKLMSPKNSIKGYQHSFKPFKQSFIPKGVNNLNNLQKPRQLNICSSIPTTKSYIQPNNPPMPKNTAIKFKVPMSTPGHCTPLNTPPTSNKSLPEGPSVVSPISTSLMTAQYSEKKIKTPQAGKQ